MSNTSELLPEQATMAVVLITYLLTFAIPAATTLALQDRCDVKHFGAVGTAFRHIHDHYH
jgi:hypothetical protein